MKKALALFFTLALLAMSIAGLAENAVDVTLSGYLNPAIMPDDPSFQMVSDILGVSQLKVHAQDNNLAVLSILLGGSELADASFEADGDTLCINSSLLGDITLAIPMEEIQSAVGQETGIGVPGISQPDFSDVSFDNTMAAVGGLASKLVPLEIGDTWEIDSDKPDQGYELALSGADVKAIANALQQDLQSSSWLAENTVTVENQEISGTEALNAFVSAVNDAFPEDAADALVVQIGVSNTLGPVYVTASLSPFVKENEQTVPARIDFELTTQTAETKKINGTFSVSTNNVAEALANFTAEVADASFSLVCGFSDPAYIEKDVHAGRFDLYAEHTKDTGDLYISLMKGNEAGTDYDFLGYMHGNLAVKENGVDFAAEFAPDTEADILASLNGSVVPGEAVASRITDNRIDPISMSEEEQSTLSTALMTNVFGLFPTLMENLPESASSALSSLMGS